MLLEPFGDGTWRGRLPPGTSTSTRRRLLAALRSLPEVRDALISEAHVLVVLTHGAPVEAARAALVATLAAGEDPLAAEAAEPREHVVRVRYDGADLADVARASGLPRDAVIAAHSGATYEVALVGFLPGFAYLRGLPPALALARRPTPRARVPPLSVAIAGPYTGVYPFASPGGWHLLGVAVGFTPFDARAGATMALGDRVRFVREAP